jgi:hypothetical protein
VNPNLACGVSAVPANVILVGIVAYLCAHFFLYAVRLRKTKALKLEAGIFLYHLCSVLLAACVMLMLVATGRVERPWAEVTAVLSLHGIYSISFLELWSLAQGGYSLGILLSASRRDAIGTPQELSDLQAIGDQKRQSRLQGLARLGLIKELPQGVTLTPLGQVLGFFTQAVVRAANLRSLG